MKGLSWGSKSLETTFAISILYCKANTDGKRVQGQAWHLSHAGYCASGMPYLFDLVSLIFAERGISGTSRRSAAGSGRENC